MGFSTGNEYKGFERKYYTGVENFKVIATSPTKAELEALWDTELGYDLNYVGTTTVRDGDGEREVKQVKLDFYLTNGDVAKPINTKATIYLADTYHKSATGKFKVINAFGQDTWLTKEDVDGGTLPGNMTWYDNTDVKIAKRGEVELIDFLKNVLDIPFNNDKLVNKSDGHASLTEEELKLLFTGDFSPLRRILATTNNKVGLVCGVKTSPDGKLRQVVYTKKALRQYSKHSTRADKFKWVGKSISETQAQGGLSQVDFGADDYELREFSLTAVPMTAGNSNQADAFDVAPEAPDDLDF